MLKISPTLSLPLDAVTSTFALLAIRRAGKSNAGRVMAEEMFAAGAPFVAIDPVGAWFGLRSSRDGVRPGLPIPIFGGRHADVSIERGSAKIVADLIVEKRLSCVIDLSAFEDEEPKKDFLLAFAKRLFQRNKDPLHLFLEEADDYIPQKPLKDHVALKRAWENIVRRGGARGLGITLITQRSAVVNKDVLTQTENLIALRITGPQDRDAVKEWIKYHGQKEEILESLASLEDGEAWIWSPHFLRKVARFHFRLSNTFDSGATPKNIVGRAGAHPTTMANIDLEALRQRMAETLERAKAEDPAELRKQIAALSRKLAMANAAAPNSDRTEIRRKLRTERDGQWRIVLQTLKAIIDKAAEDLSALAFRLREAQVSEPSDTANDHVPSTFPGVVAKRQELPCAPPITNGDLPIGERKVLMAIAQYVDGASRDQLCVLTGYRRSSRDAYIQRLREKDYVEGSGDALIATQRGIVALGDSFEPLPSGVALQRHWLQRLSGGERRIFEVLLEAKGHTVTREKLDERTGYKRSSRDAYLQRLIARRLVERAERGHVKAARTLFE